MNLILGLGLLILLAIPAARAQSGASSPLTQMRGLSMSADESDRDNESDTLELRGNVQIIFKDQHMSCDSARINFRAKTIDALGNVLIVGPKATVGGDRIYLDYESNTGVIYTGFVQSGNVYFEGRMITRTSEVDYIAENAKFTTCTNCPESWSFSGQKIRAELGGYAYIKNSFLRFGGFPLVWLPYLAVPLKSDRQSGLLTPSFELSDDGGLAVSESFFWAMGRSQDSTWTFKNYELRGLKSMLNYRYVLSENSSGELDDTSLRDRVFASSKRLNQFRNTAEQNQLVDRWSLKYQHYLELPDGYVQRMQLNNVSDLQYPKDFSDEIRNYADPALENRVSLTKNTRSQHYSIDTSYYVNLMQANPLSGNSDAVHRLPELRFSQALSPLGNSGFLYKADVNYVNFARSEFAYDDMNVAYDPTDPDNDRHLTASGPSPACTTSQWYNSPECRRARDGSYDPSKDIIRTGQRLDAQGTISRPVKVGDVLSLLPEVTYRETQYRFGVGEDTSNVRRYLRAGVSAKSVFSSVYGPKGPGSFERFKHEIEPEISMAAIPWLSQPKHSFFGVDQESQFFAQKNISDADINGPYSVQFDYYDRVYDRKLVTAALTNKLIQKRWIQGSPNYRQVVSWRVAQSYDFYQAESNLDPRRKEPYSDLRSDLKIVFDRIQLYQRASYYPYQQVTNSSSSVRLLNRDNDYFQVAHQLSYNDISPGREVDPAKRTEEFTFTIRKNFSHLELLGAVVYDINPPDRGSRFKSYGYGAQIRLPGNCWYFDLQQYRVAGGDNQLKFNFNFIWDGQTKPSLPDNLLSSVGL